MARLERSDGSNRWFLPTRCLLGRSRACTVHLDEPEISGEHAIIRWVDGAWELQDLHSRNGTYVNSRALGAGQRVRLLPGAELGFGRPGGFVLADASKPEPHALPLAATGSAIAARDGLLVLPSPEEPELTLFQSGGQWMLKSASEVRAVEDGDTVDTRAGRFRVHVPVALPETYDPTRTRLPELSLCFSVARSDEYIELLARCEGRTIDLKARAHHRTLLQLARRRIADRQLPPAEQGWMHQDELMQGLGVELGGLHLDIHRIRRQLAEAGVADAASVIERRFGTRQLRIGVQALEITPSPSQCLGSEWSDDASNERRRDGKARSRTPGVSNG